MHELNSKIVEAVRNKYGVEPYVFEKMSWGYNSTTFYLEGLVGSQKVRYAVKLSNLSKKRLESLKKDLFFAEFLSDVAKTPKYVKNRQGEFLTVVGQTVIKVSEMVDGIPPFDMNFDIFKQVLEVLKRVHTHKLPSIKLEVIDEGTNLLHCDLTPSNVFVSHGNVVGITDFEFVCIGLVEYDIAKSVVFCWYSMWYKGKGPSFKEVFKKATQNYKNLDEEKLKKYALFHAKHFLEDIKKHKESYADQNYWKYRYDFAKERLKDLRTTI